MPINDDWNKKQLCQNDNMKFITIKYTFILYSSNYHDNRVVSTYSKWLLLDFP